MSVPIYQITGYSSNSITYSYNPNFADYGIPETRLTIQNASMNRFMLGKIMAAQEVFRERGAAIAYPFLASPYWDAPWLLPPERNNDEEFSRSNPNGTALFAVGDQFLVSTIGRPFTAILGFFFYNTMVAVNKLYLRHTNQNSNAIVMNSVGLGDHLLKKIRELPNGSERQELVGVMVYLVTNGFFTAERIHALYPDVEADISHAKEIGIEHESILPYPHRDVVPFTSNRPVAPSNRARNDGPSRPIIMRYSPMTDGEPPGFETSIVRRLSLGNCLYKPEFFRAHTTNPITGSVAEFLIASTTNPMTREVTDRVTDEEILINRNITLVIISRMSESE